MNSSFEYLDIILLAIIAGFIILRLWGILGRRTGHEKKDFGDLFGKKVTQSGSEKKVVNLSSSKLDDETKEQFIKGAKAAYEMIITSFAKGDKITLKPLLNKEIYKNFSDEIDHRKKENLKSELTFVGVKSAEIKNFEKNAAIQLAVGLLAFYKDFISEYKFDMIFVFFYVRLLA